MATRPTFSDFSRACSSLSLLLRSAGGDDDGPRLRADTFTQAVVTKLGDVAQFDCQYDNAVSTDWYRDQRRLIADSK